MAVQCAVATADARSGQEQRGEVEVAEVPGRGAISMLQEFVQCSKVFQAPQHRPILKWNYDTRMPDFTTLEFRATVAFVLDGVPHHVAGEWHLSKKLAQRDAAERALVFFITAWGEVLLEYQLGELPKVRPGPNEVRTLEEFCRVSPLCEGSAPTWSLRREGEMFICTIEVTLLDVPHQFAGSPASTEAAATADVTCKVLWYMRCPGFEDVFEPDPDAPAMTSKEIPSPPTNWASGEAEEDALTVAERKTALMRVQNRLQQAFAKQLRPGQSLWEWSYETDASDEGWPPLCRATVHVPVAGRTFTGDWARGQRDGQISTSKQLTAFIDAMSPAGSAETAGSCPH